MRRNDKNDSTEYCIAIWPEGTDSGERLRYGTITLLVFAEPVLREEEITVGGYSAWKGTYDNKKHWDYISLRNTSRFLRYYE